MKRFPFPLRFSIPVILLLLGSLLGWVSFQREVSQSYLRTEENAMRQARFSGNQTSGMLEYLFRKPDREGAELLINQIGADSNTLLALLCDEKNRVLFTNHYKLRHQLLSDTPAANSLPLLNQVRQTISGRVALAENRQSVRAIYPVYLTAAPGELRSSRVGILLLEYDISALKARAYADALERSQAYIVVLGLLCFSIWLFFYKTLTRRVSQLVQATDCLAKGEFGVRAGLQGCDELAQIAAAFDQMAQRIRVNQKELQRLATQREELLKLLANQIRNSLDLDSILSTAVDEIHKLLQVDRCNFSWYTPHETIPCLNLIYEVKSPDLPSILGKYPITTDNNSYLQALLNLKTIRINNLTTDTFLETTFRQNLIAQGYASFLSFPIHTHSGKVGTISCGRRTTTQPWSDEEVELLQSVANQLAIAIDQAELYEQTRIAAATATAQAEQLLATQALLTATLESTADGILVVDSNGKITSFNQKFAQMWDISSSRMALQDSEQTLAFAREQLKNPEAFFAKVKELETQPEVESFDILEFKDGRIFERYSQPQQLGETIVGRVWSFHDVTERYQAESALRQSEKRLRKQNQELAELAKSQTLNLGNLHDALKEITQAAAHTLEIERTSVWLYNENRSKICCVNLYECSTDRHSTGHELVVADNPKYFQALEKGEKIIVQNAASDPRTRDISGDYLAWHGIRSVLDVPIWLRGQMVGIVCHEHVGSPREWALEDQNFAGAIADLVSLALEAQERQQAEEKIRYQALHDLLTGLPNRMLFNDRLALALANARREGGENSHAPRLAVMFLDLDRFKTINDTLGHAVGDRLLQCVTERLSHCLRQGDTIARWGGDEFTLLLPHISCKEDAAKVAQRILEVLKLGCNLEDHLLHVSSSIGIALYPNDGEDAETLIKNADIALYRAKEQGRSNYQFYNSAINSKASELLALEHNLHQALERGEFVIHYQPQVNTATGKIIGMEALVRWQHPTLGLVSPGLFIPLAEETGLILPINEWVLRTACEQNKLWQDLGLTPIYIAVNLSARQFQQPHFVEVVAQILAETGLSPDFLELEITESAAMKDVDFTKATLNDFHRMGVSISIDDFGTGYSSLSYLKEFPLHTLKIDQSFIRELTTNSYDAAIVKAIIALGRGLNLSMIAEGVETKAQQDMLRSLQCEVMQGYLFSRPLPAEDATKLLRFARMGKAALSFSLENSSRYYSDLKAIRKPSIQ